MSEKPWGRILAAVVVVTFLAMPAMADVARVDGGLSTWGGFAQRVALLADVAWGRVVAAGGGGSGGDEGGDQRGSEPRSEPKDDPDAMETNLLPEFDPNG
jgi:hypothetical protein